MRDAVNLGTVDQPDKRVVGAAGAGRVFGDAVEESMEIGGEVGHRSLFHRPCRANSSDGTLLQGHGAPRSFRATRRLAPEYMPR